MCECHCLCLISLLKTWHVCQVLGNVGCVSWDSAISGLGRLRRDFVFLLVLIGLIEDILPALPVFLKASEISKKVFKKSHIEVQVLCAYALR